MPGDSGVLLAAALGAAVVGLDQLTKAAIVAALGPGRPISRHPIAGDWVAIEYAENRGAAFGVFSGLGPLLVLASIVILLVLLGQYRRAPHPRLWRSVALGAIAGGAVGNLLDRVRLGYVVDFIAVGSWPNFNIADSAITIGVGLMLLGTGFAPGSQRGLSSGCDRR